MLQKSHTGMCAPCVSSISIWKDRQLERSDTSWSAELSHHPCGGKQLAGKANLHSTEEGLPYISRISWWAETPLVIGVKENVSLVCHEVLSGTHSTGLTQPSVICLLNHSHTLHPCPHAPFSIPAFISKSSASFCMATEGRSNGFLLLMKQGVSVLCSRVELQQIKRV